jgi:phage terminase large subunit-like protein
MARAPSGWIVPAVGWAGQNVELEPWQEFALGSVHGWLRKDGTRRFRSAYNEVSRKMEKV